MPMLSPGGAFTDPIQKAIRRSRLFAAKIGGNAFGQMEKPDFEGKYFDSVQSKPLERQPSTIRTLKFIVTSAFVIINNT